MVHISIPSFSLVGGAVSIENVTSGSIRACTFQGNSAVSCELIHRGNVHSNGWEVEQWTLRILPCTSLIMSSIPIFSFLMRYLRRRLISRYLQVGVNAGAAVRIFGSTVQSMYNVFSRNSGAMRGGKNGHLWREMKTPRTFSFPATSDRYERSNDAL